MITLYIGKSGAGKDAFLKKMVDCGVQPIVSYTTRPARPNEVDGVDYHFISVEKFMELVRNKEIMEYRSYKAKDGGSDVIWYYGSPYCCDSIDYVGVVTISGVYSYIKEYGPDKLRVVYVDVDDDIRRSRAEERLGREFNEHDEEEWNRRLIADAEDFSRSNLIQLANDLGHDITVLYNNGDFDRPTFGKIVCS